MEGEIFITLGTNPTNAELSEIEKVAERYPKEKDEFVYIMNGRDYLINFYKLTQIFLNIAVVESEIGRIIAYQLLSMKFASYHHG